MHLLAKQFFFEDSIDDNSISYHIFDHLDEYLGILKGEIRRKGSIVRKLKNKVEYKDLIGQIEIASFFKSIGFEIELEPQIPDSTRISDIKISKTEGSVYVEVLTIHKREGEYLKKFNGGDIRKINKHPSWNIRGKIEEKTKQLSPDSPGIIAFVLDPQITIFSTITNPFGALAHENPIISGLLLYYHSFSRNGCKKIIQLYTNPDASIPIFEFYLNQFEKEGIQIR